MDAILQFLLEGQLSSASQGNQNEEEVLKRKRCIKGDIYVNFDMLVLAWCHREKLRPDFIASTFAKVDSDVEIRDKWAELRPLSSESVYSGMVAEFRSENAAFVAAKELTMLSRSVMTLRLSRLLDMIIDAESRHSLCEITYSTVYVGGKRCISDDKDIRLAVEQSLRLFGNCGYLRFYNEVEYRRHGIICELTYPYASQAYAAKFYLDGLFYRPVVRISVEIDETYYEKEIMQMVKLRMIDLLDEGKIVPLRD